MTKFVPTSAQVGAALDHAAACQPHECCGAILADGSFAPVPNMATETGHFIMDRLAYVRLNVRCEIVAIVHSHVYYPPVASETDRVMCEKNGLPWLIISWPSGHWCVIEPQGYAAPLIGREWQWGSSDCYGTVRDGFHYFTGILLPDYPRDWLFWRRGRNDIDNNFKQAGFMSLPLGTPPRHCDLFAMCMASEVPNHLALFVEPDKILHQLYRQLSVRELYGGMWREKTVLHLRHESLQ